MIRSSRYLPVFAFSLLLSACGGGGGGGGSGTLSVALTDAPACGYDNVWITVSKVRAHKSGDAAEGDDGWSEIVLNPPRRLDLLALRNGELEDLGQTTLAAGRYTQLRLVLDDGAGANELVLSDTGETVALTTPSGEQSGLKLNHSFEVTADESTRLVLDFDACRSIVQASASGRYLLKPVIAIVDPDTSGSVVGSAAQVEPAAARAGATVSLQAYDAATGSVSVVRSTSVRDDGSWLLSPVPPAPVGTTYQLVIASPGYSNVVYTNVPVQSSVSVPVPSVTLAESTARTIDGTVAPAAAAAVRALQTVVDEPGEDDDVVVEAAFANADESTGAFALTVQAGAPRVAPYVSSAPVFVDGANAGVFTVTATVGTQTRSQEGVDVSAGDQGVNFAF